MKKAEKIRYKKEVLKLVCQIKDERFLRMLLIIVNDYLSEKAIL